MPEGQTPPAEQWRIDYDMDTSDVVAFNLFHSQSSRSMRRTRLILFCVIGIAAILVLLEMLLRDRLRQSRPPSRLLFPLVILIFPVYILLRWRRMIARRVKTLMGEGVNRNLVGRRTLILTPDVVTENWPLGKFTLKWAAFERIEATAEHLFMYQSALTATTVPRRAFNSQAEFDSFVAAARRLHRAVSPGFCKGCGYDMVGITSGRCPECGRPLPNDAV